MSTGNRITTRSKNVAQRPGLLVPKQTRRTSEEVAASRRAKEDAKKEKEDAKKAGIKRVAEFEQNQAENDAIERTPRVVTKPNPLVRTRSYADVLRSSDVEMADATAESGSQFELAAVETGQTTDDGMETAVQNLPPRKNTVRFLFLFSYSSTYKMKVKAKKDGKKPRVRDAIKAIQDIPEKNLKRKKFMESSESESMEKDLTMTPKPCKKNPKSRALPESDDDLPAPPKRVVRPALINDSEDLPPKEGAKKNKGKGKEVQKPDNKGKATNKGADQRGNPKM
jgi:hypothetical protein